MLPGGTNDKRTTREDRATQPLGCWKAEFRNSCSRCFQEEKKIDEATLESLTFVVEVS